MLLVLFVRGPGSPKAGRGCAVDGPPRPSGSSEPVPGCPKRPITRDEAAAKVLRNRTLTNPYNTRPDWLASIRTRPATPLWLPRTVGPQTCPTTMSCPSCWR